MFNVDRIANGFLAGAAVVVAASLAHRELAPRRAAAAGPPAQSPPVYLKNWREVAQSSVEMGPDKAPVKVLEFADFECPFCRSFDSTMKIVERKYPNSVSREFVHLPLTMHRFARPAARAAECAGDQDRFRPMHDVLFQKQDSLGLKSWGSYASEAGVPDTLRFLHCVQQSTPVPRVEAGVAEAAKLQVRATPTVIINGWRFAIPPTESTLVATIDALLANKIPPGTGVPGK